MTTALLLADVQALHASAQLFVDHAEEWRLKADAAEYSFHHFEIMKLQRKLFSLKMDLEQMERRLK